MSAVSNLDSKILHLTYDIRYTHFGRLFRPDYVWLLDELNQLNEACKGSNEILPLEHKDKVLTPFINFLIQLGEHNFKQIFSWEKHMTLAQSGQLPKEFTYYQKVIPEVAETLLQFNHERLYDLSSYNDLKALQAVVSDLYTKVAFLKTGAIARDCLSPLVKWGTHLKTPYTYPHINEHDLKIGAGIVNLPSGHRLGGIGAWVSLGHEVVGHNFLRTVPKLLEELTEHVVNGLKKEKIEEGVIKLWTECVEESASDILCCLAIGPTAPFALLAHARALQKNGRLSNQASRHRLTHPPSYLRLIMCSITVQRHLKMSDEQNKAWDIDLQGLQKQVQEDEKKQVVFKKFTRADPPVEVSQHPMEISLAIKTAELVAVKILTANLKALRKKEITKFVCWDSTDENFAYTIQKAIEDAEPLPKITLFGKTCQANHIIAGAMMASLKSQRKIEHCFIKMKEFLIDSYKCNTYWSPPKQEEEKK